MILLILWIVYFSLIIFVYEERIKGEEVNEEEEEGGYILWQFLTTNIFI